MNSRNLKMTYFQTYERFFIENNVVVSTPFVMNRSGDVLNNYCWIWLKQQLPLRLYMGYSKNNSGKININKVYHLDFHEYKFIETNALEYAPYFNDLNRFIQKKYQKLCEKHWWIDINILSEVPRWVGLWFWSVLALWLSVLMNKIENNIDNKILESLIHKNINEQLGDEYSGFYKIFSDALEFDKHIYGMVSSWTKLASFFYSYYPVVSFSEDNEKNNSQNETKIKRYFGFKLNDLYPELREVPYAPIDYWVIYSGKPVLLEQIAWDNYKNNGFLAQQITNEIKNLFGDFLDHLSPKQRPKFYKHLIEPEHDEFTQTYGKLMWIISLKMLYFMSKVYRNWYDEASVLALLDSFKKLRQADCVTRDSSHTFLVYIKKIIENFKWSSKYLSIAPNDTTIMWWSVVFMLPLEWFRTSIMNVVETINNEFLWSKLLYANWLDGLAFEWCKIEQDILNKKYSEFLDWRNCTIKRSNWKIIVGDCNRLLENQKKWLLLDNINNKLYLNGQKLTSQELHSQSATIEILKKLLDHPGKDISNKEFPISSYSKNKNDMLGKIVIPLVSLIEKKTKKKLPLTCKGSLYDFVMRLDNSDIEMTILNSIS